MSAPTLQTTALMTEHLGYPPVSLLDDIINCVNDIMYKCISAMEKYLLKKSVVNGHDYSEEIRIGVAQLETLLENSVDRNFDRLELYVLRNILHIPDELISNNVFRLKHQRNLILANESLRNTSQYILQDKVKQIEYELIKNEQLTDYLSKLKNLKIRVGQYKQLVQRIGVFDTPDLKSIYESLKPIDNSISLLSKQLKQLYESSEEICSTERINSIRRERTKRKPESKKYEKEYSNPLNNYTTTAINSHNSTMIEIKDPDVSVFENIP